MRTRPPLRPNRPVRRRSARALHTTPFQTYRLRTGHLRRSVSHIRNRSREWTSDLQTAAQYKSKRRSTQQDRCTQTGAESGVVGAIFAQSARETAEAEREGK